MEFWARDVMPPGSTVFGVSPDRIVILNDLSLPKGGATSVALEAAYAMRKRGLSVTLIVGDAGENPLLREAAIDVVALRGQRLRAGSKVQTFFKGLYNPAALDLVSKWIDEHDNEKTIYHIHGWSQTLSPSVFKALARVRKRLVISAHDYFLACPNGSFSYLKTGKVCPHIPLSSRCLVASCDRRNYGEKFWRVARQAILRRYYRPGSPVPVLPVHASMAPLLVRSGIPAEVIHVLPNPVRAWQTERIFAERNREILFVGRLETTKGPHVALAAARAAGVTLRVIGEGSLLAELQNEYPEMIFMGACAQSSIADYAAQARLLLMPSLYPEPYGLVAVEALWSGLPVLLPPTAHLASAIVAAGAGEAINPSNVSSFAHSILELMNDDIKVERMSISAFTSTASLGLEPNQWSSKLLQIYVDTLNGNYGLR